MAFPGIAEITKDKVLEVSPELGARAVAAKLAVEAEKTRLTTAMQDAESVAQESRKRVGELEERLAASEREGAAPDNYIKWRVEGTEGLAKGTIGWPDYPNASPSTIDFTTTRQPGCWFSPRWREVWFPDAFEGVMGQLLDGITDGTEPAVGGHDNLKTVALVDACYKSLEEQRPVNIEEILAM